MSDQSSKPATGGSAGGGNAMTPAKASEIQSHAARHPQSATARTGFDRRAQSAAAKPGGTSRR